MLFFKKRKKSGFILIETLILLMIISSVITFIISKKTLFISYENNNYLYNLDKNKEEIYREVLLSKGREFIEKNQKEIESLDLKYKEASLKYKQEEKLFLLTMPYNESVLREEYYSLDKNKDNIKFRYVKEYLKSSYKNKEGEHY